ncbi:T9SS type A sorting domain-containing protein [Hymenobacter sp. BT186]|uniref:T9SS type A sorting domain-containing protein n=1 Tax=Hymenobacter telluris TaxID=2816474 RepID=A0A939EXK6_9BACT|nr:T9SS type A sorting domain-containing protein [Hymenobacter telluris]MBO0358462.1 T9SS type A sorting domain-containing protein [Hymenobacter telluris]MBW3374488.1 T9SS type A sorting domain-containing protein [Hymenobacter norwichensis]
MRILLSALFLTAGCLLSAAPQATAQAVAPTKQWDKTFGGSGIEYVDGIRQTSDGGYIIGGTSFSGISGDKTQASQGDSDYWIVKVDASGTKQWDRSFGGTAQDILYSLQQTSDGGYILAGQSDSGIGGDKTQASQGSFDYWVIKLDASGTKQWDRSFGGNTSDYLYSVQQTTDGGYVLGGHSYSGVTGDKTQPNRGLADYWIVKVDASGTKQWDKTFGGSSEDLSSTLQQTSDGGYIIGGASESGSSGDKTQPRQGLSDYWIVKLDASGSKQWDRSFGGSDDDYLQSLQQPSDGGYILAGSSSSGSSTDKTQASQGGVDYWVLKLDASGAKQWDRTIGGSNNDVLNAIQQTSDGGYILGGKSNSSIGGDKTQASQGSRDYWLVKLSMNGTKLWDRTFGGNSEDAFEALQQTSDGGYILAGWSESGISGDKTQASQGSFDCWIVKLSAAPLATTAATISPALSAYPNPARTQLTLRGPLGTPYQLLNQLGQVMLSGKLTNQPLDVHSLPAGLYLLRDQTTGRITQLVKE